MMIRLFFFGVALVTGAVATPVLISVPDASLPVPCVDENQNIKEYFNIQDLKEIKWDYVKTPEDLVEVLKNNNHMIVVDVDNVDGKNVISGEYKLDDFLDALATELKDDTKKRGVKYNIKSKEAFKEFIYTPTSPREGELPPFPQWFHINVAKSDGQADDTVIDVSDLYNEQETGFKCYTFSFGWGANKKCSSLSDDDINNMITEINKYNKVPKKNLVIDIAHILDNPGLEEKFETFTFIMDENNAKCSSPKSLASEIKGLESKYGAKLLKDEKLKPEFLNTHEKLCAKIDGFLGKFKSADLTEFKWKQVASIDDLEETIKEHIARVDIDKSSFDEKFEPFINKFATTQVGKGLLLNFKDQEAVEAYWNVKYPSVESLTKIPISIQLNVEDFDYNTNKWIDCYTPAFGIRSTNSDKYTPKQIEDLTNEAKTVKSDERMFALDLIKVSGTDHTKITELIKNAEHALLLRSDKDTIEDVKNIRSILVENIAKTFIDAKENIIKKINAPVKIAELIPGIEEERTDLEFKTVKDKTGLTAALKTSNSMIQVETGDLSGLTVKECIDAMGEKNDNALKLRFSSEKHFTDNVQLLQYRNFPIWIHLDVDVITDLSAHKEALTLLGHQLVLGSKGPIDIAKLETARGKVSDLPVTVAVKAQEYNQNKEDIDKIVKTTDDLLIWMKDTDSVISKDLRDNLKSEKYYLDIPNRFIMVKCPANQEISDFSKIKISKYVESEQQLKDYLGKSSMIRAKIVIEGEKVFVHDNKFTLEAFLSTFQTHAADKDQGIIFTFDKTDTFEKAMVEEMKTFNYPIWFDVNVFKAGTNNKVVDLDYNEYNDFIDCRTLTLGLVIPPSFAGYTTSDINNLRNITFGGAKVYTIRAEFLEEDWPEVEALISGTDNKNKILSLHPEANAANFKSKEYRSFVKEHENDIVSDFPGHEEKLLECPSNQDVESYFGIEDDLSKMLMSSFVQDKEDLINKLDGGVHMIRAKISKGPSGLYVGDTAFTLEKFIEEFETNIEDGKKKGIIFTIETTDIFAEAMIAKMKTLNCPIWFEVAVDATAPIPEARGVDVDGKQFNDILDCRTMLPTIVIGEGFEKYEDKHIEALKNVYGDNNKFSFLAEYVTKSWDTIEPLLDEKKIFVFMPEDSEATFNTKDLREKLKDAKKTMFVDLQGSKWKFAFIDCPVNQNFIEYFSASLADLSNDLSVLRITDPLKTEEEIQTAIKKKEHILSVSVNINEEKVPTISEGVAFRIFLNTINSDSDKSFGAKITFESQGAFDETIKDLYLLELLRTINRPIWIDVLAVAENDEAKDKVIVLNYPHNNDLLDCRTLSLGWAGETKAKYNEAKVKEMNELSSQLGNNQKLFVVELLNIVDAWSQVRTLIEGGEVQNFLTLLSIAEDADKIDYPAMEDILEENKGKLLFDMPDVVRKVLHGGCGSLSSNLLLASILAFIVMIFQ